MLVFYALIDYMNYRQILNVPMTDLPKISCQRRAAVTLLCKCFILAIIISRYHYFRVTRIFKMLPV